MKKNNLKMSGFTLIELLVVITIIGILASIVVVNLNSARGKGQDTAIKEQMSQMRAQASLYYDDNYGYSASNGYAGLSGPCPTTAGTSSVMNQADFVRSLAALKRNAGASPKCYVEQAPPDAPSQNWVVATPLRTVSNKSWCVDAIGNAMEIPTPSGAIYTCQ